VRRDVETVQAGRHADTRLVYGSTTPPSGGSNWAWGKISAANALLGEPIGNQRTNPPPPPAVGSLGPVTGAYASSFTCTSVCSGTYSHRMTITGYDASSGRFTGPNRP